VTPETESLLRRARRAENSPDSVWPLIEDLAAALRAAETRAERAEGKLSEARTIADDLGWALLESTCQGTIASGEERGALMRWGDATWRSRAADTGEDGEPT
jgi:hypothetical protein